MNKPEINFDAQTTASGKSEISINGSIYRRKKVFCLNAVESLSGGTTDRILFDGKSTGQHKKDAKKIKNKNSRLNTTLNNALKLGGYNFEKAQEAREKLQQDIKNANFQASTEDMEWFQKNGSIIYINDTALRIEGKDTEKCLKRLADAWQLGSPYSIYNIALVLQDNGYEDESVKAFKAGSDFGCPNCSYWYGVLCHDNDESDQALIHYRKAAESILTLDPNHNRLHHTTEKDGVAIITPNKVSSWYLGMKEYVIAIFSSDHIPVAEEAFYLKCLKLLAQVDPEFMHHLAEEYNLERCLKKDPESYAYYLVQAADLGDKYASHDLALMLWNKIPTILDSALDKVAFELFELASSEIPEAYFNLSLMVAEGRGCEKNLELSLELYEQYADSLESPIAWPYATGGA